MRSYASSEGSDEPARLWKIFRALWCCHILTDKGNGRQTDRKSAKNVYPVMEVVSVAVKIIAEVARSTYVPNK